MRGKGRGEEEGDERGGGAQGRKRLGERIVSFGSAYLAHHVRAAPLPHLQAGLFVWLIVWGRETHWQGINL